MLCLVAGRGREQLLDLRARSTQRGVKTQGGCCYVQGHTALPYPWSRCKPVAPQAYSAATRMCLMIQSRLTRPWVTAPPTYLLKREEHGHVPRTQAAEVGNEALIEGQRALVARGLDEAVKYALELALPVACMSR
mgnify:CR=1 FL=1